MTDANETENQALIDTQRLKSALHYTVGQICEEVATEREVAFSKHFIAALAETTFRTVQSMSIDLELFAKHGKRTTINKEDVKLLVRKSPGLHRYISELAENQSAESEARRKVKTKKLIDATLDDNA